MEFRFVDVFGRRREIELEVVDDDMLLHSSGRLYRIKDDDLRLVGSFNHPEFDKPATWCNWVRRSLPIMFSGDGAKLGRILR